MPDGQTFRRFYRRARDGDADAFQSLAESIRADVQFTVSQALTREMRRRIDPTDAFQETMLTLFERISTFPNDLGWYEFRAYVMQLARWKISGLRRGRPRERGESAIPTFDRPLPQSSAGPVTRGDDIARLDGLVDDLSETQRDVIRLCIFDGRPTDEAAKVLGISSATLRQRLVRARRALQERWKGTP